MDDSGEGIGPEQLMGLLRQLSSAGRWGDVPMQEIPAAPEDTPLMYRQEEGSSRSAQGPAKPYDPGSEGAAVSRKPPPQQQDLDYWLEELRAAPANGARYMQALRQVITLLGAGRE